MGDLRIAAWLVRRVALRGRGTALPALLLGVGMVAITLLGLTSMSARQVVDRQDQRATAIAVHLDPQSKKSSNDLSLVSPEAANGRRWNGHEIRREFYAAGTSNLVAPGVPAMPSPGEFYASPDLIALMKTDPVVAGLFESQRLVGEIATAGLVQPHELRAVLGVASDQPLLAKVVGFGGTPASSVSGSSASPVLDLGVAGYVLALVWIPAAFFVVVISRLAAARRRPRAAALHLIGYPRWRIRSLSFLEAASCCVPAVIVSCVVHWAVARTATTMPGTTFGYYSADAQLPVATYLLVAAGLLFVVCFTVSSDRIGRGPRRAGRERTRDRSSRAGTASLAVGLALLALPTVVSLNGPATPLALWVGIALAAIGIAVAGPVLVSRLLAARAQRASASPLVGRRMAAHGSSGALRLASVLSVLVVLLLGGQAFASVLNGGSTQDWSQRAANQGLVPIVATDLSGALSLAEVSRVDPLGGATELRTVRTSGRSVKVVFSSCERLDVLTGRRSTGCTGTESGPRWLLQPPANRPSGDTLALPSGTVVELPANSEVLDAGRLPSAFAGALLLPPELAPNTPQRDGAIFYLLAPASDVTRVLARLASLDPILQLDLGALDRHNPATQPYRAQIEWLGVGAVAGLLVGFLSLLVASLGEAQDRSPRMRAMRVLGASRRNLAMVHLWSTAVPPVLVGFAAIAVGWLAAQAMRNVDERAAVDPQLYRVVATAVVLSGLVVWLVSWRSVTRPSQRGGSFDA